MNVSSQSLRRRQSVNTNTHNPRRRGPISFKKRSKSSSNLNSKNTKPQQSNTTNNDALSNTNRRLTSTATNGNTNNRTSKALDGIVACLSGQTEPVKNHTHTIISNLGGTSQGTFDARYVTHLILDYPIGSKYELYKQNLELNVDWATKLYVVSTSWVEACEREGKRVSEVEYKLQEVNNNNDDMDMNNNGNLVRNGVLEGGGATNDNIYALPKEIQHISSLEEKCDWMIENQLADTYCNLFSSHSILLVGFSEDEQQGGDGGANNKTAVNNNDGEGGGNNSDALKQKISKLIRRAGGTIFWEPNEWVTTVILNDGYSKHLWDDVRYFCREHPKGPICVSVEWMLKSIFHNTIIAPPFPPEPQQKLKRKAKGITGGSVSSNNTSVAATNKLKRKSKKSKSIFRGDVFAVVPLKTVPTGTLEYNYKDVEDDIVSSGGILLSKTILLAIKKGIKNMNQTDQERNYYVVSPRSLPVLDSASPYPLIAELAKIVGINVVMVSPVWIAACINDGIPHNPEGCPLLFQPQSWSNRMLKLPKTENGTQKKFLVSVTGYVDANRYGIKSMVNEIGADWSDNLSRKNTHLICKQPEGQKYIKALEWGVHVVSIEWLYHIVRYGYDEGSEDRFLLNNTIRKEAVEEQQTDFDVEEEEKVTAQLDEREAQEAAAAVDLPPVGNDNSNKESPQLEDVTSVKADVQANDKSSNNMEPPQIDGKTDNTNMSSSQRTATESEVKGIFKTQAEDSSSQSSSPSRRGKRDRLQASPPKEDPRSMSRDDPKKRLQFALNSLSATQEGSPTKKRRRGKRDKSPKPSQESVRRTEDDEDEEFSQNVETQFTAFTVGSIRANADIHIVNTRSRIEAQVPLSAMSHVEDNGESQLVWFAGSRGK